MSPTRPADDASLVPEGAADERVAHLVRLAARGFERALRRRLDGEGIGFGQWVFLRILWEEDGLTQRSLSERARLTAPTTHTAIARLEALGHVRKVAGAADRRRQHVHLTSSGRRLRERLEPLAIDANAMATEGLDDEAVAMLRRTLRSVIGNLERDERSAATAGRGVPATRANRD